MAIQVCIVGLGLIGGSIALSVRREHDAVITGVDINEERLQLAKTLDVIDQFATLEDAAKIADLIVLSTPVQQSEKIIDQLANCSLKPGVIVTDVGSTKEEIVEHAKLLIGKGIQFIGGHPMAGSHKSGVEAARAHLFENAFYILTPMNDDQNDSVSRLKDWLKGTKANFVEMSPQQHDQLAGAVSHFPHIIAASLVHQIANLEKEKPIVTRMAAGGFRDITRIASSNPEMWRDILIHNKEMLLDLFDSWKDEMETIKQMIVDQNGDAIFNYFTDAKNFRDGLPVRKKGAIPAFYDLFVDVPDYPGVISEVTAILAKAEISITNIRIIETREDILGVLRLSFRSEDDRGRAVEILNKHNYETYIST